MSYKTATPYTIQIIQTDNVVPMDELNKIIAPWIVERLKKKRKEEIHGQKNDIGK